MNNFLKGRLLYNPWLYAKVLGFSSFWYYVGRHDKKDVHILFHNKGYQLSQSFKNYPVWDKYAEPILISQFTTIFTAGYSFLEGLVSDNENQAEVQEDMNELKQDIINQLDNK